MRLIHFILTLLFGRNIHLLQEISDLNAQVAVLKQQAAAEVANSAALKAALVDAQAQAVTAEDKAALVAATTDVAAVAAQLADSVVANSP